MPSPLEQILGAQDVRDPAMDPQKRQMLMQLLLQNPVNEGQVDPTSPYYASGAMVMGGKQKDAFGGVLPDRSRDPGIVFKPSRTPSHMAPQGQAASVSRISGEAPVVDPGVQENTDHTRLVQDALGSRGGNELYKLLNFLKGR